MSPGERPAPGVERFLAGLLTRGRAACVGAIVLVTALLGPFALRIPIERNDEAMASRNAADRRADAAFRRDFGGEETVLTVTLPRLLEPEGLRLLDRLTQEAARLDGVTGVRSLTNAVQVVPGPDGPEPVPVVPRPFDAPGGSARILAALDDSPRLAGLLVSPDRRTAAIMIRTADRPGGRADPDAWVAELRRLVDRYRGAAELHLSGIGVEKHDVVDFIRRDKAVLIPASVLVLVAMLWAAFRRASGVAIPVAVKAISLAWTMGIYGLAGYSLNPITALLPPLVIVLSISTSVHLYSGWLRLRGGPGERAGLIAHEAAGLFAPCLYTALATAVALLSLLASDTPAVRQFGAFGALGVMISFLVSMTLVPAALSALPLPGRNGAPAAAGPPPVLQRAARVAAGRPAWVVAAALVLAAAGGLGVARVRNNTDLLRFLKTSAPLYRDTMFVDREMAGVYSLDMLVSRKDGRPLTSIDDIRKIAAVQDAAARQDHVAAVFSVADPLRMVRRAETGGKELRLPDTDEDLQDDLDLMAADRERSFLGDLMTRDLRTARISVRVHAVGTAVAAPLVRAIEGQGARILGDGYTLVPTGSFYRVTRDSNRLVERQAVSLALCLAVILLAVGVMARSGRLAFVALAPTLVPVLLTGGLMGYLAIDLSAGTAMIFPVALGLIVDNTIHYLSRYLRERGGDVRETVVRTAAGAGGPIAASSLVLALAFGAGAFGSFKPTIAFSLLTGAAMLASLASVLLVLPSCLVLADRAAGGAAR